MTNLSNTQISILHYWSNGIRSAHFIHRQTKIPLSTVKYNIKKLKETNSLKHRGGNGRPRVINSAGSRAIDQYIRRNNETTLKEIKEKFCQKDIRDQYRYQRLVVICVIMAIGVFYLPTRPC